MPNITMLSESASASRSASIQEAVYFSVLNKALLSPVLALSTAPVITTTIIAVTTTRVILKVSTLEYSLCTRQ